MRRLLAIAIFAAAATGTTLAGSGLVVAPHVDPPGTPAFHDHVLAAYRFPIFLMRLQQLYDDSVKLSMTAPLAAELAATVLGLLLFAWPRLPRPARRPGWRLTTPLLARPLWSEPLPLGPPRA